MPKGFKRRNNGKSQLEIDIQNNGKKCLKCLQFKKLNLFIFVKTRNLYEPRCKTCKAEDKRISLLKPKNRLKRQIYMKKYNEKYRKTNFKKYKRKTVPLTFEQKNKKKIYRIKNRDHINLVKKEYCRKMREIPKNKVDISISSGIRKVLGKNKNGRKWETLVDFTITDLEKHLESKFDFGMSWNNYGYGDKKWVIDHVIPKEMFEYETSEDPLFKMCWSLNNLKPLWKKENDQKSDFLPNGMRARELTKEEKLDYLESLGYKVKTPGFITKPDDISCTDIL